MIRILLPAVAALAMSGLALAQTQNMAQPMSAPSSMQQSSTSQMQSSQMQNGQMSKPAKPHKKTPATNAMSGGTSGANNSMGAPQADNSNSMSSPH